MAPSLEGVEVDINYYLDAWVLSLSASYIDTERTDVRPPLIEGEPLVYAPRTNAHVSLQYNFTVGAYESYIRSDVSYVGEYESGPQSLNLAPGGDYVDANLRLGVNMNRWDLALYGKNITNNDDLRVQNGTGTSSAGVRARPLRIGLELTYAF